MRRPIRVVLALSVGVASCSSLQGRASGALEVLSTVRLGISYGVSVWGEHVYVTNNEGVVVLDVSDPTRPRTAAEIAIGPSFGIHVAGNRAYVAGSTGGLTIVDVSNPAAPEVMGSYVDGGSVYGVHVTGSFAYLADLEEGLEILDVSQPENPFRVGRLPDGGGLRSVAVLGGYAYLANVNDGLKIVDITSRSSPREVATVTGTSGARKVLVAEGHLFLGLHTQGIKVFDLTDPTSPVLVQELLPGEEVAGLSWSDQRLCVSLTRGRVSVMDLMNVTSPDELGAYEMNEGAHGIVCNAGLVFAVPIHGLAILKVLGPSAAASNPSRVGAAQEALPVITARAVDRLARRAVVDAGVGEISGACFSPDGERLAIASFEDAVRIWDLRTLRQTQLIRSPLGMIWGVEYSPDGSLLALWGEEGLGLWGTDSESFVRSNRTRLLVARFSPDGRTLATGGWDGTIKLWDVSTGEELHSVPGHGGTLLSLSFTPDGRLLASGGGAGDTRICLWDPGTLAQLRCSDAHDTDVHAIAFSPTHPTFVSTGPRSVVKLWPTDFSAPPLPLMGHDGNVFPADYTPDGSVLMTMDDEGLVILWDPSTGEPLRTLATAGGQFAALSPDGTTLAFSTLNGRIELWSLRRER